MKIYLTYLLAAISCASYSQYDTIWLVKPDTEKRNGWYKIKNEVKKLPAYAPDAIIEEGMYKDGKKEGLWKMYYPAGTLKSEITFKNNHPCGHAILFYEEGCIQEEGWWENNRWTLEYKQYYDNCKLKYHFHYNARGKRNGEQSYYDNEGILYLKVYMSDGCDSACISYDKNGNETKRDTFNVQNCKKGYGSLAGNGGCSFGPLPIDWDWGPNVFPQIDTSEGKPFDGTGPAKLYNRSKQISKDGTFKNYRLMDGKDYIYNSDGILIRIAVYKKGKYAGDAPMEEEK